MLALDPMVFYIDSLTTVINFDGYLNGVSRVTFSSDSSPVIITSMTVTAVPVPAAVWLFGYTRDMPHNQCNQVAPFGRWTQLSLRPYCRRYMPSAADLRT